MRVSRLPTHTGLLPSVERQGDRPGASLGSLTSDVGEALRWEDDQSR